MDVKTYTTAEAAALLGVSRQTLYTWIVEGKITAPKPTKMGQRSIRFWTKIDVERVLKFKNSSSRRGPKPKAK